MSEKIITLIFCGLFSLLVLTACAQERTQPKKPVTPEYVKASSNGMATFGAGCFWCVEPQFNLLEGVDTVLSGYSGGATENPTYQQVSTGRTGYAEVVNVQYDTAKISYDELLEAFFLTHDPTQIDRQGNDVGTQYRSVIFAHSPEQREKCRYYISKLERAHVYDMPIATSVKMFEHFYPAEDFHHQYYQNNKDAPYCSFVIQPKMDKFKKIFRDKIKASALKN